MKKILVVIESLGRGGAERLLVTTLTHLDRACFDVSVVSLFGPNPLAEEIRALGIDVDEYLLSGPKKLVQAAWRLRRTIRERRIDVVHTHLFTANVAGRVAAAGYAPVLTTLHNPDYGSEGAPTGFGLRRILDGATAHLLPPSYLAVSRDVKNDYRRHLSLVDVEVLYNYLDVPAFQRRLGGLDRTAIRDGLGISTGEFTVLHVGRLHRQKGHDVLLDAFSRLVAERSDCRLVLAGEGPLRGWIERRVASLGLEANVRLLGAVPDPGALYVAADAFAFPSRYEAFGMSLLEAMAAGLPSVVSGTGGILELACPTSALVVSPSDGLALFEGLSLLRRDPERRAAFAAAGRRRAMSFDVSVWLPELERVYAAA